MPPIAEYNAADFNNQSEADKALLVRFYPHTIEDKEATKEKGHQMFKEVEFIEIRVAGQRAAHTLCLLCVCLNVVFLFLMFG